MNALCIFTTLLGNKPTAQRLIETIKKIEGVTPTFIIVEAGDYARYKAPRWARATDPWEAQAVARQKARTVLDEEFDLLLVNSWELVTAFSDLARRIPAVALMDAVPATIDLQLRRRGYGGWKRSIANFVHNWQFARSAPAFRHFLPMGSDCSHALERKYAIPREHCTVTLAPQELETWKPAHRSASPYLRLLFVTNDFVRKGGDFLLHLFAEHLTGRCTLTIASNDLCLESRTLPPEVIWLRGRNRDQLLDVYRNADLFLFPTAQDYMPQVLAEALAVGLPCIATDVGGICDLIQNGQTGFLMPYGASEAVWAEKILRLHSDRSELTRLAAGARNFAEQYLDIIQFEKTVGNILQRLLLAKL